MFRVSYTDKWDIDGEFIVAQAENQIHFAKRHNREIVEIVLDVYEYDVLLQHLKTLGSVYYKPYESTLPHAAYKQLFTFRGVTIVKES